MTVQHVSTPPCVVEIRDSGDFDDVVSLTYEDRLVRRKRLETRGGRPFRVDFQRATELPDNAVLHLETGMKIAVQAAPEDLLEVRSPDLVRMAWHVGNRHTPCEIGDGRLRIKNDPVLRDMLERLGAEVVAVCAPFRPEGGAYGQGRTFGHDHSHDH